MNYSCLVLDPLQSHLNRLLIHIDLIKSFDLNLPRNMKAFSGKREKLDDAKEVSLFKSNF
jgi:hypothetical protein